MHNQTSATKIVIIDSVTFVEKISNEQRINRNRLQEELNAQQIQTFSFESYRKDADEIKMLKALKSTAPKTKKYKTVSLEQFKDAWKESLNTDKRILSKS